MFNFKDIIFILRMHPKCWLFVILETTLLLGVIQPFNKLAYQDVPRELAYSLLYTGCAMSTFYYGYGIVQLRTAGACYDFLCRICGASLKVWKLLGFLMLLPWGLKICEQLKISSDFLCLNIDFPNIDMIFGLIVLVAQVLSLCTALMFSINHSNKMTTVLRINQPRHNQELRAYAQALNRSLGFEMIRVP
ncbi:hypothetical protein KR044_006046 [Drosophila immigrans]|nr:hypothetical protein KR044_006046 [Drosophila immigrans]